MGLAKGIKRTSLSLNRGSNYIQVIRNPKVIDSRRLLLNELTILLNSCRLPTGCTRQMASFMKPIVLTGLET